MHDGNGPVTTLDRSAAGYRSSFGPNNLGDFGWTFVNPSTTPLNDVKLLVFLDADIDRALNTFFNEFGDFISLSLPPGTPAGAIAATSWQIDEPGFVFGTILQDLHAGALRDNNSVPDTAPDDVSLALGFAVGPLNPGQSTSVSLHMGVEPQGGLRQTDPDSGFSFYFNGYALNGPAAPAAVPEPATVSLLLIATLALAASRRLN